MTSPPILKKGERITADHYGEVTSRAYSAYDATRRIGAASPDPRPSLFLLTEHAQSVRIPGADQLPPTEDEITEQFTSAKAIRLEYDDDAGKFNSEDKPDADEDPPETNSYQDDGYRVYFLGTGLYREMWRKKGELVYAIWDSNLANYICLTPPREPDVWLKNTTGAKRLAGDVVGIRDYIQDNAEPGKLSSLLFDCVYPFTSSHRMGQFAVLRDDVEVNSIVGGYNTGTVTIEINRTNAGFNYVDARVGATNRLSDHCWGWGRILWSSGNSGVVTAVVDFNDHEDMFLGRTNAQIASGGNGAVSCWWKAQDGGESTVDETVYVDWMTGGGAIEISKDVLCKWFKNERLVRVINAAC